MKFSKTTQILVGALFLGIAAASATWLFIIPHDRGMTDPHAQRLGYVNAAQRDRSKELYTSVRKSKHLSEQQTAEIIADLKSSSAPVRINALVTLDMLAEVSQDKREDEKAVTLTLTATNHPDPDMRIAVADTLAQFHDFRATQALRAMTQDSAERVRQHVEGLLRSLNTQGQSSGFDWKR